MTSCDNSKMTKWSWEFSPTNIIPLVFISKKYRSRPVCSFNIKSTNSNIPKDINGFFTSTGSLYIDTDSSFKYCAYQIAPIDNKGRYPMRSQDGSTHSFLYMSK